MAAGVQTRISAKGVRRAAEGSLIAAGLVLLAQSGLCGFRYWRFQHQARPSQQIVSSQTPTGSSFLLPKASGDPAVIGRLQVQRLGLSVLVVEGDDDKSLELGAGHMPGTAKPGALGNVVISGHRDTAFWPLRNARVGDVISLSNGSTYNYRVSQIRIVDAMDVTDLADTKTESLTLVSCYPFRHVGASPKRFIVKAKLQKT